MPGPFAFNSYRQEHLLLPRVYQQGYQALHVHPQILGCAIVMPSAKLVTCLEQASASAETVEAAPWARHPCKRNFDALSSLSRGTLETHPAFLRGDGQEPSSGC